MARQLGFCFLFLLLWANYSVEAELLLEEQLRELRENYMQFKEAMEVKVSRLEMEDARLKALLELKDRQQEILAEKVSRLELRNERETSRQLAGRSAILRTCREIRAADPSASSGMYWIDPDGQGVGDDPIYVHCDMASGSTAIPHDSEASMDVGHCPDPGCYSRAINYNATSRQMSALAELSAECHQSIKYDCNFAPLEFNLISYSWWNDRNGNSKTFWAGDNTDVHLCQCGLDGNCVDPSVQCNCDSMAPVPLVDDGTITDKNVLPITRLNFGRTQLETSSGVHTLGHFECTGQVAVSGMPSSCADLWRTGHSLSGLYSVVGTAMVESVYCDFAKLPSDSSFQTWIGFEDVKSSPTYFYVQISNSSFNVPNVPITFDAARLNVGGAMNLETGKFTAPRKGKYFFSASGLGTISASSSRFYGNIHIVWNGNRIGGSVSDDSANVSQFELFSLQSTLNLQAGDQIWWEIGNMSPGFNIYPNGYNNFSGVLLEEEITDSLKTI
ncbi:neurexin-4-like isoform X2 [Daphnia pulex]|uniref:neurexin-4-like isoform X2 n=1 Tax=Daphnia pulex TaxID=6669 RepID=UPI001EDF9825|nr:neurexin-4-like isoform X2 [Daphnia pulex]